MDHRVVIAEREVSGLVVARVGRVEATTAATLPWVVLDGAGRAIKPASEFLRELLACGNTPASCRSYAFDLLRWFRFLAAVDIEWSRAKRADVRDFVLWLRTCHNPARDRRRPDAPAPGSLNARTGKPYLRVGLCLGNHQPRRVGAGGVLRPPSADWAGSSGLSCATAVP
ncbi:site-specific integrase [Streptomyces sp. AK02-01A]|uniref:site-specific integrase n=1 Tax=Streptomyces sp. AK02-01A TaxID=3028648 RepID=UPI0029B32A46|nr:site-specific integrase [Streptomyces sp. AK02-01A]MDX3850658.1 site-specific integrase [Streptomyces sp. AK02-01A]